MSNKAPDYFEHMNDASFRTKYTDNGQWWSLDGVNWYEVPKPIFHSTTKAPDQDVGDDLTDKMAMASPTGRPLDDTIRGYAAPDQELKNLDDKGIELIWELFVATLPKDYQEIVKRYLATATQKAELKILEDVLDDGFKRYKADFNNPTNDLTQAQYTIMAIQDRLTNLNREEE